MPLVLTVISMMSFAWNPSALTVPVAKAAPLTSDDLQVLATNIATEHKLNVDHFKAVINMESGFNVDSLGDYVKGTPTSIGIAQLHYPSRDWGISTSTAHDPITSLEIMAKAWEENQAYRWSAWCLLYGTSASKCPAKLLR